MKTKNDFLKLILLTIFCHLMFGCNNSGSNSTSTAAVTYHLAGGLCYNNLNQLVSITACGLSSSYILNNGVCYSTSTGQVVTTSLCGSTTATATSCTGYYFYNSGYGYQSVYCSGTNCSGATLLNSSGVQVYCQ